MKYSIDDSERVRLCHTVKVLQRANTRVFDARPYTSFSVLRSLEIEPAVEMDRCILLKMEGTRDAKVLAVYCEI